VDKFIFIITDCIFYWYYCMLIKKIIVFFYYYENIMNYYDSEIKKKI